MAGIELIVEPGKVYGWEEFRLAKPPFSIGLDGIIAAPTMRDPLGPYANFDHHTGADRLATRSTSGQVYMEINMGLFDTFKENGLPRALIHANDPDEDTDLAIWLLEHHELVRNHAGPAINRLVFCEDVLDSTAGAYPLGNTTMRRKMAWMFEPYNAARFSGALRGLDAHGMRTIIEAVGSRITDYVNNGGQELELKGQYERIGGGTGWAFVQESGPASRMAMYSNGINAFATLVASREGASTYVLGRRSVWTQFPLQEICGALNAREGDRITPNNKWDGSNTIVGSPRKTGSSLSVAEVEQTINETLAATSPRAYTAVAPQAL